jgi:hypothetical protein
MNNEAFKQNLACVAHSHVGGVFWLDICCDSVSSELWFCRLAIVDWHSSDVDNTVV